MLPDECGHSHHTKQDCSNKKMNHSQGCQKAPATGEITSYFEVFTSCKLAGISEKKWPISITIKYRGKKSGLKLSIVSLIDWMYFVMRNLQKKFPLTSLACARCDVQNANKVAIYFYVLLKQTSS